MRVLTHSLSSTRPLHPLVFIPCPHPRLPPGFDCLIWLLCSSGIRPPRPNWWGPLLPCLPLWTLESYRHLEHTTCLPPVLFTHKGLGGPQSIPGSCVWAHLCLCLVLSLLGRSRLILTCPNSWIPRASIAASEACSLGLPTGLPNLCHSTPTPGPCCCCPVAES